MINQIFLEVKWTDAWLVYCTGGLVIVTLIIAFKANSWAHKYWRKQKKEEINYHLEGIRYQGRLEAAKAAWGLLAFLTEKENGKNILIYKGTKEKPEVYFNLERGNEYIKNLSEIFHDKGHGIFLTKEINQEIFHVRTTVFGFLHRQKREGKVSGEILVENPGVVEFFRLRNEDLRIKIKKYVMKELKYEIDD